MYEASGVTRGRARAHGAVALACIACLLLAVPVVATAATRRPAPASRPFGLAPVPAAPAVAVTSGDMADALSWEKAAAAGVLAVRVQRAASAAGPWTTVLRLNPERRSANLPVRAPARNVYRLVLEGAGGTFGAAGTSCANDRVLMARTIGSAGGTLASSNGDIALTVPPGALAASTRIGVAESAAVDPGDGVPVTGRFTFTPDGTAFAVPVTVRMRYALAVPHFQVAAGVEANISLRTYDSGSGAWLPLPTTLDTAGDILTASLSHFSEYEGAAVQPHGTSGDKTGYCSGVCHDLVAAPGSSTLIAPSDPAVCYNCHGGADPALGPDHATGSNVQASFFACPGQVFDAAANSMHPVGVGAGKVNCTVCHDPHAAPASAPMLLRAANYYDPVTRRYSTIASKNATTPGTEYCWTCHGVKANAAIGLKVPGYWFRAGDKQTTFNGAHTSLGAANWRYDSVEELKRGYTGLTEVLPDGTVKIAGTVMLPKTPRPPITASPTPSGNLNYVYDGLTANTLQWFAKDIGAAGVSESNPMTGTASLTIDLGSATRVSAFDASFADSTGFDPGVWSTDVLEIQTSDDAVVWRSTAVLGTVGTRLADHVRVEGSDTARYVRFVFTRRFAETEWYSICPNEVSIYGPPAQGTYEVWPDIARKAAFAGGSVRWTSTESASASITVSARASASGGTTWTAWQPMVNGGALTVIPAGSSLENARLQVRATLNAPGASPTLNSLQVLMNRGAIVGAVPQWSGATPRNLCQRCHTSHGGATPGLVSDSSSTTACKTCHSAAYGSSYVGAAQFAGSKHAAVACADCHVAHGGALSTGADYAFLLRDDRADACLACHPTAKYAFGAKEGAVSEWSRHDVRSADQVASGGTLACRSCHGTHFSSTGVVDPDSPTVAYTAVRDDPASIPTSEVVIYATKDAMIESTAGREAWNYGASTSATITPSTRLLAYFDLSAVPAGATIQHAQLVLWGTTPGSSAYAGGYLVYPMTRGWAEGTGTGTVNDGSVNGATWLEWQYHDNANTGNTALGDWTAPGGDNAASPSASGYRVNSTVVTSIVTSQRQGTNYGIVVMSNAAGTSLPIYTRHNASLQYRPRLRIVYQTGPATRQVTDDITFCSRCHDATMPTSIVGITLPSIGKTYMTSAVHGGAKGVGPESSPISGSMPVDSGGGYLKAPYSYGMDALPCGTCHDPHGSRLPFHLRETLNGRDMTPLLSSGWGYEAIRTGPGVGYFCGACHVFPTEHKYYETAGGYCFNSCHAGLH